MDGVVFQANGLAPLGETMSIRVLTTEEHIRVVERLVKVADISGVKWHAAGPEYTSLMACFLLHQLSAAEALLSLQSLCGSVWFPAAVGYTIVRPMFEINITAHYITKDPANRSRQYVDFGPVLTKRSMDACSKHRSSPDARWREAMGLEWQHHWASREAEINSKYQAVRSKFETVTKNDRRISCQNWSGRSLRQMAIEVDHEEAYDMFYAELSSFTHADVHLADGYLRIKPDGLSWTQRPNEFDVANVFRHAASFLTCFLELFGEQFRAWSTSDVEVCWNIGRTV